VFGWYSIFQTAALTQRIVVDVNVDASVGWTVCPRTTIRVSITVLCKQTIYTFEYIFNIQYSIFVLANRTDRLFTAPKVSKGSRLSSVAYGVCVSIDKIDLFVYCSEIRKTCISKDMLSFAQSLHQESNQNLNFLRCWLTHSYMPMLKLHNGLRFPILGYAKRLYCSPYQHSPCLKLKLNRRVHE
jgi:hypothetical protein